MKYLVINLFLFLLIFALANTIIVSKWSFGPLIMDDEVSYIINAQNLLNVLETGYIPDITFEKRPLSYSIVNIPGLWLLNNFSTATPRRIYNLFIFTNILFSTASLTIFAIYLFKTFLLRYRKLIIPILATISFIPTFFLYNFYSLSESYLIFVLSIQMLISYNLLKQQNIKSIILGLIILFTLSFVYITTKETGIITLFIPSFIYIDWLIRSKYSVKDKIFTLIPALFVLFLIISFYQYFLINVTRTSLFNRGSGISIVDLFSQLNNFDSLKYFLTNFIKLFLGQLLYISTISFSFILLSTILLISNLFSLFKLDAKYKLHFLATTLLILSSILTVTFFSLFSLNHTPRYDFFFYERYNFPFFVIYILTLIPVLYKVVNQRFSEYLIPTSSSISFLTLLYLGTQVPGARYFLNIPSLFNLFYTSIGTVIYAIVYAFVVYFIYISIRTYKDHGKYYSFSFILSLLFILLSTNNMYLYFNDYKYYQFQRVTYKEIIHFINNNSRSGERVCFYQPGKISFQYWYHRYYLTFNNHRLILADDNYLINCNYLIVDEYKFDNDNFEYVTGLKVSNTKLYIPKQIHTE